MLQQRVLRLLLPRRARRRFSHAARSRCPAPSLPWPPPSLQESDRAKQASVAAVLGLGDSEAETLRGVVEAGNWKGAQEEKGE